MTQNSPVERADFNALLELLDRSTMRDVIRLFVGSSPARLEAAAQGIGSGDAPAAATAFHTLRSACGQLGAHRMESLCADAERAAKKGDLDAARGLLDDVRAEYERCVAWFSDEHWLSD